MCPSNNTKDGETALLGNNSGFSFTCCKCCKISPTDDAADRVGMLQKLSISCKCCDVTDFDGHSKDDDKEKAPEDRTASSATGTHCQCQIMFALATDRRTVARINDTGYSLCYIKALEEVINCWKSGTASEDELHVVCLNGSLSLIPLLSAKSSKLSLKLLVLISQCKWLCLSDSFTKKICFSQIFTYQNSTGCPKKLYLTLTPNFEAVNTVRSEISSY